MSSVSCVLLNLVTCMLIFFGGIGFLVIRELFLKRFCWKKLSMHAKVVLSTSAVLLLAGTVLLKCTEDVTWLGAFFNSVLKRFCWKKLSMHAKVVLSTSAVLLLAGTVLLKCTEDVTWLGAFFNSVSARTAGFSTYALGDFSNAGLLVMTVLMFIGASPGSTGGGIKTSTFFALLMGIYSAATNHSEKAFKNSLPRDAFRKAAVITTLALFIVITATYLLVVFEPGLPLRENSLPRDAFRKAAVITTLALFIVITATYLLVVFEPGLPLRDALFEMTSAFGTVGLSTGITAGLSVKSKLLSILIMFIGRLGPLTIASLWHFTLGEAFGTVGLSTGITAGLSVKSKLLSILIMFIGRLGPLTIASLWHFTLGERVRYPEGNISIG